MPLARFDDLTIAVREARRARGDRRELIVRVLSDRRLMIFAGLVALFTFANAAMLPLASGVITKRAADAASLLIAAGIVLPQAIVALLSPAIGRLAEARGRRLVLMLGFSVVPVRGMLFAVITDPLLMVAIQALDGIAAACFGVMVPLVTNDITGGSGRLNLSLGFVGFAIGIGATLSTAVAGWTADVWGDRNAFLLAWRLSA